MVLGTGWLVSVPQLGSALSLLAGLQAQVGQRGCGQAPPPDQCSHPQESIRGLKMQTQQADSAG